MYPLNTCKNKQILVGIWKISPVQNKWSCIWFDDENMPQSLLLEQLDETFIMNKIAETFPQNTTIQLKFITAISPHKVFLKTLILPYDISPKELETQCIITLEENLPIPLDEVWFDFMSGKALENQQSKSCRIDIFAVVKQVAIECVNQYCPLNIQILDCALNALVRGFHYFASAEKIAEIDKYDTLYFYRDNNYVIIFANQPQNWLYQVKKNSDPIVFIEEFCQRNNLSPLKYLIYDCASIRGNYPLDYQLLPTDFAIIPLGCALWDGEDDMVC